MLWEDIAGRQPASPPRQRETMRSRLMQEALDMSQSDRTDSREDYYVRRALQERALAERAGDPSARYVHDALAKRYAEMVLMVPACSDSIRPNP